MIELDRITPDAEQPRKRLQPEHIRELAASIRELGVLQPITVRFVESENTYRIIAGECRFRAAREAGLTELPCWVRSPKQNEILLEQIVENWQRADLNPFELADSLAMLRDSNGYTQQQLAETTGKSTSEISKLLAILHLSPEVQIAARSDTSGKLTKRHLYALTSFPPARQLRLISSILAGRYTAQALERLIEPSTPRTQSGKRVNWQRRTFRTEHAEVRFSFRKSEITDHDILQAVSEIRADIEQDNRAS